MKKNLIILCLLFASGLTTTAQKFSILGADAGNYPQVVVGIEIPGQAEALKTDFKVREKGAEVDFVFSRDVQASEGRAICFLIEASGNTYGTPVANFRKAVSAFLEQAGNGDVFNVGYFGKANTEGRSLNVVSAEFTSDKATLISELQNKVKAPRDTTYQADVFKSIYECLDFMNSKQGLPQNKMLVVISAAINNSRSPLRADDCIEKANGFQIPVYTITYRTNNRYAADNFIRMSDKTGGKSKSAKSVAEISSAIRDFMPDGSAVSDATNKYSIEFTTVQKGEFNTFEIEYLDEKLAGTFTIPDGKLTFWDKFMALTIILIVVFVLLVAIGIWFFMQTSKKKKSEIRRLKDLQEKSIQLQQQMNQAKEDKTRIGQQEPQKFDLKKTQIGGGGGSPVLMVSAGTFSKSFALNKPSITIGRNENNDVVIPEQTVSGHHATLTNEGGNWCITDSGSTNGTFVNGVRITKQRIAPNDMVKMGAAFFKIQL
jgi:hypothetical protein